MPELSVSKLKAITSFTDNKALNALDKINKLAIPTSVLDNMSKTTNAILKVGLQQSAALDRISKVSLDIPSLSSMAKIGKLMEMNRLQTLSAFDGIAKTAFNIPSSGNIGEIAETIIKSNLQNRTVLNQIANTTLGISSLGNIAKIGKIFEDNRKQMISTFDSILKIALVTNKITMPNLIPVNKAMLSIHKNLANSLSDKSWKGLFQNLENLTADINLSDVKIESQGDTLVINDEVITEESINNFTETLSDFISNGKKKSIELLGNGFKYLLKKYIDYYIWGLLFLSLPENSMLRPENLMKLVYSKPTTIQQKQIKQIKFKQKAKLKPQYIANRRIMPVYSYANRTSPVTNYLVCGEKVKILKSINKKRWLFVEWVCDGEKESGWVLGRYILKTSSKKSVKNKGE